MPNLAQLFSCLAEGRELRDIRSIDLVATAASTSTVAVSTTATATTATSTTATAGRLALGLELVDVELLLLLLLPALLGLGSGADHVIGSLGLLIDPHERGGGLALEVIVVDLAVGDGSKFPAR